jgi:cysteine synthase A
MARVYKDITELVGSTPLVDISRLMGAGRRAARLIAKLESFNPLGSVKDRIALSMIEDAEARGVLRDGSVIVEPTSGNTGIGLAFAGAARSYRVILTMPEHMSAERQLLLKALGAEVVLTPQDKGMQGSIDRAKEIADTTPGAVILGQFENPANPGAHMRTTAREILADTGNNVDAFVACVGSGGTITGTGRGLKRHDPAILVVAVEPAESAVLSGGLPGRHGIQGIGAGFVPANYDPSVVDEVVAVRTEDAFARARELASGCGILAGISSGAALHAGLKLAGRETMAGKTVVVLLPDTGERYLSTSLFSG